ncbi:unnamed protein product [Timema podura]|uniref:Sodefrin-like factor n=1 Tax=Timema podura TaxID=61482 RepID=A0ABN7PCC4_TIMPD|nr:unnamed protein product [Timema podura]
MKMSLFITSLLICLLFQKGLAIKCIACSTEQDPKCASTYAGNKEEDLIECRDTVTACLTMIEGTTICYRAESNLRASLIVRLSTSRVRLNTKHRTTPNLDQNGFVSQMKLAHSILV